MSSGKINKALRLLSENPAGGVLDLNDKIQDAATNHRTVRDILNEKHPPGKPADQNYMLQYNPDPTHYIRFENLNADTILKASRKTKGAAGLSGTDAHG